MILLQTRSRKYRSCEMMTTAPSNELTASSSDRRVSTSKSFVGSSKRSTLTPDLSVFAKCTRLRSPPDKSPTSFSCAEPLMLNAAVYARTLSSRPPTRIMCSPCAISSYTTLSSFMSKRDCVTTPIFTVVPMSTRPASGAKSPAMMRKSVDLPVPFPPMMPMRSPPSTFSEKLSKRTRPSKALVRPRALMTLSPRRGPGGMTMAPDRRRSAAASSFIAFCIPSARCSRARCLEVPPLGLRRSQSNSASSALDLASFRAWDLLKRSIF
mmetsp:Transcript_28654/g.93031  ORF Transcript_28654/g.93031 Transcript_28654/m.93031 type:complete len:267 (-) Transcript_28654:850-1650(-)